MSLPAGSKARDYVWTLNNYTEDELENIARFTGKYLVFGFEIGASGTKHLQGYAEFEGPVTWTRMRKEISERVHIEKRRGTQEQAIAYCKKDASYVEIGTKRVMKGQGHRTDLDEVGQMVKDGESLMTIAERHPGTWIRYNKGITSLKNVLEEKPKWRDVEVLVYWGPTGTGKTRRAMQWGDVYKMNQNTNGTLWFDGYDGEETLLLDDFYGWIKWGELLGMIDGYPYRCQTKGGYVYAKWKRVVITSNKPPSEWYHERDIAPLNRRITRVDKFD